jgi:hypothetical protein
MTTMFIKWRRSQLFVVMGLGDGCVAVFSVPGDIAGDMRHQFIKSRDHAVALHIHCLQMQRKDLKNAEQNSKERGPKKHTGRLTVFFVIYLLSSDERPEINSPC